jgi:hypothetical protein
MFEHDLDSFQYSLISLVRIAAAASLLALVWYGVAFLRRPIHRVVAIGVVVVWAMSATYFARTHTVANGETDTDDYGRRFSDVQSGCRAETVEQEPNWYILVV